jgi:hypothetical protein
LLGEVTDFELWQRAVRNQFQQGESVGSLLLGIGCLVAVVVLVLVIARVQSRWNQHNEDEQTNGHPQRLYVHLICALGFTAAQRQLLEAVAKASTLDHPAALLISDVLFDRSVARWDRQPGERLADSRRIEERKVLATARSRLFPEGRGMVRSAGIAN